MYSHSIYGKTQKTFTYNCAISIFVSEEFLKQIQANICWNLDRTFAFTQGWGYLAW